MSSLENLLKEGNSIPDILDLIDIIYYTGKPQKYKGIIYNVKDLPADDLYDSYREKYTPDVKPGFHMLGSVPSEAKIKHEYIMGTLKKIKSVDNDLGEVLLTEKLDGMSLKTVFVDGKLESASTRHAKTLGINCTDKASRFITRPDPEIAKGKLIVHGEILFIGDDYKKLGMANRRAAVSGIMGRKDYLATNDLKYLEFMAYEIPYWSEGVSEFENKRLEMLEKMGFRIPRHKIMTNPTTEDLSNLIDEWQNASKSEYDIDGIVIAPIEHTFENLEEPKDKIAFKKQSPGQWTIVEEINPRATRTGLVIPHIIVNPVYVLNTKITAISGSNYEKLLSEKINVGSNVYVIKSNQTIPFIQEVKNNNDYIDLVPPTKCPSCTSELVEEGKFIKCINRDCPEKLLQIPVHFFETIGLENFKKQMFNSLDVNTIEEIYSFPIEKLEQIPGFGKKRAKEFYVNVRSILINLKEEKLLAGLGIPLINIKTATLILKELSLEKLFGIDFTNGKLKEKWIFPEKKLKAIVGIGPKKVEHIKNFQERARDLIIFLIGEGMTITKATTMIKTNITGKIFVLTGTGLKSRSEYTNLINSAGGETRTSVTGKTNYVVSDGKIINNKITQARQLNIPIITYENLEKFLI
jgi:DNA ligase (NAD+)